MTEQAPPRRPPELPPSEKIGASGDHSISDVAFLSAIIDTQNDIAAVELEPATVMRMIVQRTRALIGADGSIIDFVEGDELVGHVASGSLEQCTGVRLPIASSLSGICARTGEIITCEDALDDPRVDRAAILKTNVRSILGVPLQHGGRVLGILKVVSARPNAFTQRDVRALSLMAGLLSSALGHAIEFEDKKRLLADRTAALTALRQTHAQLLESQHRFQGAFDAAATGMALVDLDGRCMKVNRSLCQMLGYSESEMLEKTYQSITHPDDLQTDQAQVERLLRSEIPSYSLAKRYHHKDGHVVWGMLTVSIVRDADNCPLYFVAQVQDVTESRRKEMFDDDQRAVLERVAQDRPIDEALGRLAEAIERQMDDVWASVLLLEDGLIQQVSARLPAPMVSATRPHLYRIAAGLAQSAATKEGPLSVVNLAEDPIFAPLHGAIVAHDLKRCWVAPIRSMEGEPVGFLLLYCRHERAPAAADRAMLASALHLAVVAVEHHMTTRRLAHLVRHDALTGLPNRLCFEDRFNHAMANARRNGNVVGLIALDIDHFKQVNDTHGHDCGDMLLQQFSQRLAGQIRETDTLARRGGDEFLLILPNLQTAPGAVAVAEKLKACLQEPFQLGTRELMVTSSMGIVLYPQDGEDSATLQRRADEQLYESKRRGRNGYSIATTAAQTNPA